MILILIMEFIIVFIINKFIEDKAVKKKIFTIYFLASIFQIILFIIYRINLNILGREVYYSDANVYWDNTLSLLNNGIADGYNKTYIYICAILQKLSPFIYVGWNNLFNIMCVNLSIILSGILIYEYKGEKNTTIFLKWTLFNPLIYYSLFRNLKDAVFVLFTILIGFLLNRALRKNNKISYLLFFLLIIIMIPVMLGIRPWAFVICFLAIFLFFLELPSIKRKSFLKKISIVFIALIIGLIIFSKNSTIKGNLDIWFPIVTNSFFGRGLFQSLMGFGKILLGPGPIRALFGSEYFQFYTTVGNYMVFIGALMWWIQLSIILSHIRKKTIELIKKANVFFKYIGLNIILYLLIYIMQYGGSTELRFRGTLYIFILSFTFGISQYKDTKNSLSLASILLIIITLGTSLLGL